MQLTESCSVCHKPIKIKSETLVPGLGYCVTYYCGHMIFSPTSVSTHDEIREISVSNLLTISPDSRILSPEFQALDHSGHSAHLYQIEGVEFLEEIMSRANGSGWGGIIGDEVGVGKTLQALLFCRRHPELGPFLIPQKSATTYNWVREAHKWLWPHGSGKIIMPVLDRNHIIPGLDIYIMSHDLLATGNKDKNGSAVDRLLACNIKTIIVDEAHSFKAQNSKRTEALITLITRGEIKNRIFLTGTAIVNRATEYFTMLNLCDPARFNNFASFCRNWLVPNETGVYMRIKPWRLDEFHELTSKYILRRTRKEVLKNLPPFNHSRESIYIEDPEFKRLYNTQLGLFSNFLHSAGKLNSTEILGWLAKIRAITGMAKVMPLTETADEFLTNTEDQTEKLIIGIHHVNVRTILADNLRARGYKVLELDGSHSATQKDQIVQEFKNDPNSRVLIANVLAGGVGLNLQFCHNMWLAERQWSPAHEKQFWGRCDRQGQLEPVMAKTWNAEGTIDQWLDNLVDQKTVIIGETLDNEVWSFGGDSLKEFAEMVVQKRL